jgi:hypothetical protein
MEHSLYSVLADDGTVILITDEYLKTDDVIEHQDKYLPECNGYTLWKKQAGSFVTETDFTGYAHLECDSDKIAWFRSRCYHVSDKYYSLHIGLSETLQEACKEHQRAIARAIELNECNEPPPTA